MVLDFIDIKKDDVSVAGGKGANLGEMTSAKINVPGGFVITADAYRDFLKENGIEEIIKEKLLEAGKEESEKAGVLFTVNPVSKKMKCK